MDTSQADTNRDHTPLTTWADTKISNPSPLISIIQRLLRVVLITIEEFKNNDLSLRSSALTYTVLLSMVPMLAMMAGQGGDPSLGVGNFGNFFE